METKATKMEMDLPCSSEYVRVLRLAVSGIASKLSFSYDDIENIKISVSEVFTNSIQHAYQNGNGANPNDHRVNVETVLHDDRIEISIRDTGKGFDPVILEKPREVAELNDVHGGVGMGLTFVKNLMDSSDFQSELGKGTTIKMVKRVS